MRAVLSYLRANAIACLALFVALSGTGAWAATAIGPNGIKPNAVRTRHIKGNQVQAKHLASGIVTTPKISAGAVTSGKIGDGSIGPIDIGVIPAARVDKPLEFGSFIPNDSETLADLGEPIFETVPGMYDSNGSKFVAPVAGIYQVSAAYIWDSNSSGVRRLTLKKNEAYVIGQSDISATLGQIQQVSGLVQLAPGDTVGAYVYQNSGGTIGYTRDSRMHFDMRWVAN
jgi:hypothetical protein